MLTYPISKKWDVRKDVRDYGVLGDGITDNAAALNSAITTLTSTGATLEFPAGTYLVNSTVTLKNYVSLYLHPGASIKWGGAAGGTMFDSVNTQPLVYAGWEGGIIDPNSSAGIVFDLHSCQLCDFKRIGIKAATATTTLFKLRADVSSSTGTPFVTGGGGCNFAVNSFSHIRAYGICGTFFFFEGDGVTGFLTLNNFHDLFAHDCRIKGFDFYKWADNNMFTGECRVALWANNAIGVDMNSGSPASNVGVYTNCFHHLAVDTFGVYTGRIGLRLGWSKGTKIDNYFQDPVAEGGTLVDNASQSHYIVYHQPDGTIELKSKDAIGWGGGALTVSEIDGTPSYANITNIQVNNGTLTQPSAGVARITIPIDIDGGTFTDTYINTANIDGGTFV